MSFPVVQGEKPTKTALKAFLVFVQEDEAWHKEILSILKEHKEQLFAIPGEKDENMDRLRDPISILQSLLEEEQRILNVFKNSESKIDDDDEVKKSNGKFSFLGSEDVQKQHIEEVLRRTKEKEAADKFKEEVKEEPTEEAPISDEPKIISELSN